MASRKPNFGVPVQVLERVKSVTGPAAAALEKKPGAPSAPKPRALLPREKVVAALKKLHPMD